MGSRFIRGAREGQNRVLPDTSVLPEHAGAPFYANRTLRVRLASGLTLVSPMYVVGASIPVVGAGQQRVVAESVAVGTELLGLVATGSPTAWTIVSGNTGNAWSISSTGVLTLNQPLSYATTPEYTLTVVATNETGASNPVTVTIVVTSTTTTVFSMDTVTDTWAIMSTGAASGSAKTFRPFLPWNHTGAASGFRPINGCPQVYVFPEFKGTDGNNIGVNPFSTAPDGAIRMSMATTSPSVQSRIVWPSSANATRGYRTSGSLSLMGLVEGQYGLIESTMRFTNTRGGWPEWWIVPAWGEDAAWELDVEINTSKPDRVSLNHYTTNFDTGVTQGLTLAPQDVWLQIPGGLTIGDMVKYAFHWTRDFLRFYVNGHLLREVTNHSFHTPGTMLFSFAAGNGVEGWQEFPQVGETADPMHFDIGKIRWTQSASDVANMPVQMSRPSVSGGSGGLVGPGTVVTATPAVVTGGTLQSRNWIIGRRKIPGGTSLSFTLPTNIDSYAPGGADSWWPVNILETYTNSEGGITVARSSDVLYRIVGQAAPLGANWQLDEQRVLSQDIGGSDWYRFGVTHVGNAVTETTLSGEHGVGLSNMPRSAGAVRIRCEAVVSAISGHTQLQFQVASSAWSHGASIIFPLPTGTATTNNAGWTIVSSNRGSLGGGQYRLTAVVDVDATSTGFVWLLRGHVGGSASYAGSTSRQFTLVSSSISRISEVSAGEIEINGVTFQAPGNTFVPSGYSGPWGYNRNIFAPGGLTDTGVANGGFTLRQWRSTESAWPNGVRMQWEFPSSNPGGWVFCWGYPGLTWGRGPWGPIWGTSGHPEPVKAGEIGTWKLNVDLEFTGQNANDLLIDVYTLPDLDFDGDVVNEISILLSHNGVGSLSWLAGDATAQIMLPAPLGTCAVYKQPSSPQIMVMPHTSGARRECLVGEIDIGACIAALIGIGQVDPNAWVAGLEIGVEAQRPWEHNTGPYSGTLKYNHVSVEWDGASQSSGFSADFSSNFG